MSPSSERPCKKVRFAIDDEIVGIFDRQPSKLDASTIKPVNELSESEKNQWRRYSNPEDFFHYTGWDQVFMEDLKQTYWTERIPFQNWLICKAQGELSAVHHRLDLLGMNEKINWIFVQPLYGTMKSTTDDNMIYTWIQLKRIHHFLHATQDWNYADLLSRLLPRKKVQYGPLERAFHTEAEERLTADGHRQSDAVCEKLLQYSNSYDPNEHAAPYASIIGPSGKSFIIQQLAVHHGIYVVYANLAHKHSNAYPHRSKIADRLPKDGYRWKLEQFWECYIVTSLADIEACRTAGITPAGFYNLQTKRPYYSYQKEFADRVMSLIKIWPSLYGSTFTRQAKVQVILSSRVDHAKALLRRWRLELESNGDNCSIPGLQGGGTNPKALICINEAHELFDNDSSFNFHGFRGAIRQHDLPRDLSSTVPQDGAFGVLIGTDYSMEERATAAIGVDKKLFPPIAIPTI